MEMLPPRTLEDRRARLAALRRRYESATLGETTVAPDPFTQFAAWFDEAVRDDDRAVLDVVLRRHDATAQRDRRAEVGEGGRGGGSAHGPILPQGWWIAKPS